MNKMNPLTAKQALYIALNDVGITESESICLFNQYDNGLYHVLVKTAYMKYEFYVDAANGEVLGLDMEPQPYSETLGFCGDALDSDPMAA